MTTEEFLCILASNPISEGDYEGQHPLVKRDLEEQAAYAVTPAERRACKAILERMGESVICCRDCTDILRPWSFKAHGRN